MNQQLALDIARNEEATFENYNWQDNQILHQQLLYSLNNKSAERLFYLWAGSGFGKSHILQACCHELRTQQSIYLPLKQFKDYGAQAIEVIEHHALICIDDIDTISGDRDWQEAIFHLYNKVKDAQQSILIISGNNSPSNLNIELADLRSRLSWGMIFQINELSDEGKIKTLQTKAMDRGFELNDTVCQYLINRCSRNMHDLLKILQQLDQASLAAKRRITIPFIKETLFI